MTHRRPFLPSALVCAVLAGCGRDDGGVPAPVLPARRIVAASVASAEILLSIAPRERIAAVHYLVADTRFSMVADQVGELPLVGAEPEDLLAVRPDLVVLDPFTKPETRALLAGAGIAVTTLAPATDFGGIAANIRELGRLAGCDQAATELVAAMDRRLADLAAARGGADRFAVMSLDGGRNTYGKGSLFDAVVDAAGARNLSAQRGVGPFRQLDVEAVLAWRPDALVLDVLPGGEAAERARLAQDPGLQLLPCVRRDRLVFVPSALLNSTSHWLVGAAEHLQATLRTWGRP